MPAHPSGGGLRAGGPQRADLPRLWEKIPEDYRLALCYSDFRRSYQNVLPDEQHEPVGKESGQTNHVERWNLALRQRLGRFVRKSLSFSKCDQMHEICLRLFLHRYNLERLAALTTNLD
ncbi:MAG TPA: IS1 family transposase [Longimicrobiaceae bacterium]|nr:IS1 family transposase [Longimicrobiaceae bacterium]